VLHNGIDNDAIKEKEIIITVTESGEHSGGIKELIRSSYDHFIKHESKAVYLSLKDLEPEMLREAIKASCSIPIVFSPVVFEGKQYFDGGVVDNAPIKPLIDAGCDEVILINISLMNTSYEINKKAKGITLHKIQSKKYLGSVLDFTTTHSEKLFNLGYAETIAYFEAKENVLKEAI
jgi:NTE family protein